MSWVKLREAVTSPEFSRVLRELRDQYLLDMIGKTDVTEIMALKERAEIAYSMDGDILNIINMKLSVGDNNDN